MAKGTCSIKGCGRTGQLRRSWCQKHYWRWKTYGDPERECYYSCPKGHPLSPGNITLDAKGNRHCATCAATVRVREKCTVNGCPDPQIIRGWCSAHYQRWRKTGSPVRLPKPTQCSVEGCTTAVDRMGWCCKHYTRWKIHGTTDGRERPAKCAVGNCPKAPVSRGWCKRHYKLLTGQGVAHEMKRYALKLGSQAERVDYEAILAEFGMGCHICGGAIRKRADLHMDHVLALSRGGSHTYGNIRPSHRWCNQQKCAKLLADYLAEKGLIAA